MNRIAWIVMIVGVVACGDKKKAPEAKGSGSSVAEAPKPKEPEKKANPSGRSLGDLTSGSGSGSATGGRPVDDKPKREIKAVAGDCNLKIEDVAQVAVCEYRCTKDERDACALAAARYLKGDNVKVDAKRGAELAARACELQSGYGCTIAGDQVDKAKVYYERDCSDGSGPACLEVARLSGDDKAIYRKGFDLLKAACDGGDGGQCALLAAKYNTGGNGLTKDVMFASDLRKKACEHDHATTCFELSKETDKEDKRSGLVDKACTLGLRAACSKLALELAGKNTLRSAQVNQRACQLGDLDACTRQGEDHAKRGEKEKAVEMFAHACKLGNDHGCAQARALGK